MNIWILKLVVGLLAGGLITVIFPAQAFADAVSDLGVAEGAASEDDFDRAIDYEVCVALQKAGSCVAKPQIDRE
jgi:hypothetical protein